jgi:hypothetical protein
VFRPVKRQLEFPEVEMNNDWYLGILEVQYITISTRYDSSFTSSFPALFGASVAVSVDSRGGTSGTL